MKALFGGRSESGSTSGLRRKKSSSGRASASDAGVPASSRPSEDGSRKHRSSRSAYGDDEGRSTTTPARSGTNGSFSLTESAVRALGDGDDDWEDDKDARSEKRSRHGGDEGERRYKSSRSEKERSRSRDRKERRRESTKESGRSEKSRGKSRAEDIVDGPSDARGMPSMGSFDQFPGQNSGALVGPVPQQSQPQDHVMSGALPSADPAHQFPQQIPAKFERPQFGPTRADSFGQAAEYYLDEGQSVEYQPGVRARTPNMLVNPDLHLHAASAEAHETPDTGHGSAADYYSAATNPVPATEARPTPPTRKSSKISGKVSSLAKIASTSAAAAVSAGVLGAASKRPSISQPVTPSKPLRSDPADLRPASSYYNTPSSAPQQRTTGRSPPRTNINLPAYAAGAAAAGLGAYEASRGSDQRQTSYTNTSYRNETQAGQSRSLFEADERSYNNGGNMNQNFHYHEHRGPMTRLKDGFFNLISDPDDVRRMEEYTEFIGVCKHCFDPRSTPYDGPRQHHYHRRPSEDSFEELRRRKSYDRMQRKHSSETMRRRVDKESRYYSERDRREQSSRSNVLGAGLAAVGVAAGANALFNDRKDFDDTYSVKSGHRASSAMRRRSRSSSRERRRRAEHGRIRRDSSPEYVTVRTKDGKLEKRRSSRERRDGLYGAAAGAALGATAASVMAGDSRHHRDQAQGQFVRHRERQSPDRRYAEVRQRDERRGDEGNGILGSFFSPSQNERKYGRDGREHRGKSKGFFGFGEGSSSSDEDLNFGEGFSSKTNLPLRRKRSGRSVRRRSSENIAATVAGIGATAAALAAAQKGHRPGNRNSRPELGARKDIKVHHDGRTYRPSDEEEWEDELPSDVDDASSTHSGLAFGTGSRLSHRQSMESVSSGDGLSAWGWRWGGKDKKKKRRPSSPDTIFPPDRRQQAYNDSMDAQQANGGASGYYTPPSALQQQPMQYVDPQPVSEAGSRHASMPGSWDMPSGRPGPAPLQQPQPIAPVSPAVMEDVVNGRPVPRRTASSPTRPSFGLTDAALIGAGAIAAGSIIAGQGRARKDSNVRFGLTDEQQQREDRQRRREREEAEEERRRADRTRALKEEAGRHAKEEDAKRREEDVRSRREEENRVAAEATLERERAARADGERKAELDRQRSREMQESERRRLEDEARAQEQSRKQWEAMAAQEAAREKQAKREREARIQEEINAKLRELDQAAEERRRAVEAREAREQAEEDLKRRDEEGRRAEESRREQERRDVDSRRTRDESSRKSERFEDAPPPRKSSNGWSNVAMGAAAAATVGAVMAGAEHGRSRKRDEERAREHDSHPEGQALYHPVADSEPVDYAAKQILPDQETSGTPIMDDDLFDKDFFKRKRSDSEYARVATNAREADKVVADMDDYYSKPAPSQADFFAPKEILSQDSAGKTAVAGPNADNDAQVYHGADAELRSRFGDGYGKSKYAPYGVPVLNVISPTPPPSSPAFGVKSKLSRPSSPLAQEKEVTPRSEAGASQSGKRDRSRSISWGEDRTHVYDPPTPESFQDRGSYMAAKDLPSTGANTAPGLDEVVVEAEEPGRGPQTTSYKAADLEKEVEEMRRKEDSRAAQESRFMDQHDSFPAETPPLYTQPFYESVSDTGMGRFAMDSPGTEGAPPVRGFVEGETDEPTPVVEKTPHIPGGFDDDYEDEVSAPVNASREPVQEDILPSWEPPLSKKEQKKREKAAKLAAAAMAAESFDETPSQQVQTVDTAEEEPTDYFATKKDKKSKKAKKGAKLVGAFESEPSETSTPVVTDTERSVPPPVEDLFDYGSKKDKKKSKKAARFADTFDSEPSEASTPVVADVEQPLAAAAEDDAYSFMSKKDKKKRDKAAKLADAFDTEPSEPSTPMASEAERQAEAPAEDDADFFMSKKDKKKRDKAAKLAAAFDDEPVKQEEPAYVPTRDPVSESPGPAEGDASDFFMSKKDKKKRDKALQRGLSDVSSPVLEDTKRDDFYDESPSTEVTASDADFTPKLSKKEQKKRDKDLQRQGYSDVADTLAATAGIAALTGGAAALANDPKPAEPEDEWDTPTSGKNSKKGKKKGKEVERDIRDIEPTDTPANDLPGSNERPSMPGNWESETTEKAAETSAGAYDPFQYQVKDDASPAAQDNEASADDFTTSSSKKSKKKKKRDSGRFNEPAAASPLRSEWNYDDYLGEQPAQAKAEPETAVTAEPESYANGHAAESPAETRDVDAGRGGQDNLYDNDGVQSGNRRDSSAGHRSRSRASEPAQRSDESEPGSRRKARSEVGYADDPDYYDSRSVAGSEPVGYYDSSSRSKRRSRHEDDDDDAKSTVSSRSRREKEEPATSKKEKKGGLFGLFSRKSADTVPLSRQSTHSDDAPLSRTSIRDGDEEDGERKHRKKKHREGSVYDDDDTRSVTSEGRRKKHHHRDEDDADSKEKRRSSRHGEDDFDTRSESGHRHRHHRDEYDDDDTISRAGTEGGHRHHRSKRTGGSESNDQSFLGDRVEDLPPLPASPPESPVLAPVNHEQDFGNPVSAGSDTRTVFPEFAAVDEKVVDEHSGERAVGGRPDVTRLSAVHNESGIDYQHDEAQLPALPMSRPGSPTAAPTKFAEKPANTRRHKPTLSWAEDVQDMPRSASAADTPERPGLGRPASATAVPLRFPFGNAPAQPLKERSLSFGTPTPSSTPTSPSSSHKKSRPTSSEFRPLYLVERNRKIPDVGEDDLLPSLPSSKPSSRASSIQGSDDWHSAIEDPASPSRERALRIDTTHANAFEPHDDYLDSQQNTPKASDFPHTAFERHIRQEPQFYTWEDFEQDERMHDHDLEEHRDMPTEAGDSTVPPPLPVEPIQEHAEVLPPLPASRPASPEDEIKRSDIKPGRSAKALAAAAMIGGAAVLAQKTMQSDEEEDRTQKSGKFKKGVRDLAEERLPLPAPVEPEESVERAEVASEWPTITRKASKKKGKAKKGAKQSTSFSEEDSARDVGGAGLVPKPDHEPRLLEGEEKSSTQREAAQPITTAPEALHRDGVDFPRDGVIGNLEANDSFEAAMNEYGFHPQDADEVAHGTVEGEHGAQSPPATAMEHAREQVHTDRNGAASFGFHGTHDAVDHPARLKGKPSAEALISSVAASDAVDFGTSDEQPYSTRTAHDTSIDISTEPQAPAEHYSDVQERSVDTPDTESWTAPVLTRKQSKKARNKQKAVIGFDWDTAQEESTDTYTATAPDLPLHSSEPHSRHAEPGAATSIPLADEEPVIADDGNPTMSTSGPAGSDATSAAKSIMAAGLIESSLPEADAATAPALTRKQSKRAKKTQKSAAAFSWDDPTSDLPKDQVDGAESIREPDVIPSKTEEDYGDVVSGVTAREVPVDDPVAGGPRHFQGIEEAQTDTPRVADPAVEQAPREQDVHQVLPEAPEFELPMSAAARKKAKKDKKKQKTASTFAWDDPEEATTETQQDTTALSREPHVVQQVQPQERHSAGTGMTSNDTVPASISVASPEVVGANFDEDRTHGTNDEATFEVPLSAAARKKAKKDKKKKITQQDENEWQPSLNPGDSQGAMSDKPWEMPADHQLPHITDFAVLESGEVDTQQDMRLPEDVPLPLDDADRSLAPAHDPSSIYASVRSADSGTAYYDVPLPDDKHDEFERAEDADSISNETLNRAEHDIEPRRVALPRDQEDSIEPADTLDREREDAVTTGNSTRRSLSGRHVHPSTPEPKDIPLPAAEEEESTLYSGPDATSDGRMEDTREISTVRDLGSEAWSLAQVPLPEDDDDDFMDAESGYAQDGIDRRTGALDQKTTSGHNYERTHEHAKPLESNDDIFAQSGTRDMRSESSTAQPSESAILAEAVHTEAAEDFSWQPNAKKSKKGKKGSKAKTSETVPVEANKDITEVIADDETLPVTSPAAGQQRLEMGPARSDIPIHETAENTEVEDPDAFWTPPNSTKKSKKGKKVQKPGVPTNGESTTSTDEMTPVLPAATRDILPAAELPGPDEAGAEPSTDNDPFWTPLPKKKKGKKAKRNAQTADSDEAGRSTLEDDSTQAMEAKQSSSFAGPQELRESPVNADHAPQFLDNSTQPGDSEQPVANDTWEPSKRSKKGKKGKKGKQIAFEDEEGPLAADRNDITTPVLQDDVYQDKQGVERDLDEDTKSTFHAEHYGVSYGDSHDGDGISTTLANTSEATTEDGQVQARIEVPSPVPRSRPEDRGSEQDRNASLDAYISQYDDPVFAGHDIPLPPASPQEIDELAEAGQAPHNLDTLRNDDARVQTLPWEEAMFSRDLVPDAATHGQTIYDDGGPPSTVADASDEWPSQPVGKKGKKGKKAKGTTAFDLGTAAVASSDEVKDTAFDLAVDKITPAPEDDSSWAGFSTSKKKKGKGKKSRQASEAVFDDSGNTTAASEPSEPQTKDSAPGIPSVAQQADLIPMPIAKHSFHEQGGRSDELPSSLPPSPTSPSFPSEDVGMETVPDIQLGATPLHHDTNAIPREEPVEIETEVDNAGFANKRPTAIHRSMAVTTPEKDFSAEPVTVFSQADNTLSRHEDKSAGDVSHRHEKMRPLETEDSRLAEDELSPSEDAKSGFGARMSKAVLGAAAVATTAVIGTTLIDDRDEPVHASSTKVSKKDKKKANKLKGGASELLDRENESEGEKAAMSTTDTTRGDDGNGHVQSVSQEPNPMPAEEEILEQAMSRQLPDATPDEGESSNAVPKKSKKEKRKAKKVGFAVAEDDENTSGDPEATPGSRDGLFPDTAALVSGGKYAEPELPTTFTKDETQTPAPATSDLEGRSSQIGQYPAIADEWPAFATKQSKKDKKKAKAGAERVEYESSRFDDVLPPRPEPNEATQESSAPEAQPADLGHGQITEPISMTSQSDDPSPDGDTWFAPTSKQSKKDKRKGKKSDIELLPSQAISIASKNDEVARATNDSMTESDMHNTVDDVSTSAPPDATRTEIQANAKDASAGIVDDITADIAEGPQADAESTAKSSKKDRRKKKKSAFYTPEEAEDQEGNIDEVRSSTIYRAPLDGNGMALQSSAPANASHDYEAMPFEQARDVHAEAQTRTPQEVVNPEAISTWRDGRYENLDEPVDHRTPKDDERLPHTVQEAMDERTRDHAANNDIDFAATLAAGLADAGFDPDMVVNDPAYHRRASPPAAVAEANPEEDLAAFTTKRKKKGKKSKPSDDSQSTDEPVVHEAAQLDPTSESNILERDPLVDDFGTDMARTMQQSGFDPSAIEQALASNASKSSDKVHDEDTASMSFAVPRRKKKGKKQVAIAEPSDTSNSDALDAAAFPSDDQIDVRSLPHQHVPINAGLVEEHGPVASSANMGAYGPDDSTRRSSLHDVGERGAPALERTGMSIVDGKEEMDVDEMDRAYSAFKKKERRKNKKRQQQAELPMESPTFEDSREYTPIDDGTSPATYVRPASYQSNVEVPQDVAPDAGITTGIPYAHDAPDQGANLPSQAREFPQTPAPQEWSFDALEEDTTPLADASAVHQPRSIVRDSGYQSIDSPVGERRHHDSTSTEAPVLRAIPSQNSLRSRRSAEPLHIDTPSSPAWPLEVAKRNSTTRDGLSAPRTPSKETAATPLESTTKNRASYLFTSPPAQLRDATDPFDKHASARSQAYDNPVGDSNHDARSTPRNDAYSRESREQSGSDRRDLGPLSPRTTLQAIEEESSATKRSKADTDVGGPAVIKARRRSETPQAIRTSRESFSSTARPSVTIPTANLRHASNPLSTDELINRLSWPAVDEDRDTVNIDRSLQRNTPKPGLADVRSASVLSNRSIGSAGQQHRLPGDPRSLSRNSDRSLTPTLRRIDRSQSGDLRAASRRSESGSAVGARASTPKTIPFEAPPTPPSNDEDLIVAGAAGAAVMSDVFVSSHDHKHAGTSDISVQQGYGDARGLQSSPTRPPSVRKRQSMHIVDLESRLGQLEAENRALSDARNAHEQGGDTGSLAEALEARDLQLQEREAEIHRIQTMLGPLHEEIDRLNEINGELTEANKNLVDDTNGRYATLQAEHAHAHEQWQSTSRELDQVRDNHSRANEGLRDAIEVQVATALAEKNAEILRLREELDIATEQIRALQVQIQASKSRDFLTVRDEDYFDGACQKLCQHVQQWVLRFSKLSDNRICRLSTELRDDKIEARLDNAILDGSDVDKLLGDRIRRRDVFMSVVMTMVWEYIFTRYLFGMDREQRQKLKALEKILAEVGPPRAVAQWRATTFTLLSKRPDFARQCALDTEAVAQEVYALLCALLPPPSNAEQQLRTSLLKVMGVAADLAIEMRTQRAGYIMLPPLQPEYDTNGDLVRKVHFNASLMNERSGMFSSNEELEAERGVVKIVLFPLVVKKGDENGEGEEEIVVCPAQVLVHNENGRGKKVVRVMSGAMEIDDPRRSSRLSLVSTAPGSTAF